MRSSSFIPGSIVGTQVRHEATRNKECRDTDAYSETFRHAAVEAIAVAAASPRLPSEDHTKQVTIEFGKAFALFPVYLSVIIINF